MDSPSGLLGTSRAIAEILDEAERIAPTDSKVLIRGESGVGKELLAKYIHEKSHRSRQPLVTINCAGVPETLLESELFGHVRGSFTDAHRDRRGLLEMANGGTVFLDEVGEMSIRMQTLLLRFLENGEIQRVGSERFQTIVDVRVISATNRDLLERTQTQEFRSDLYYRLNVVHLVVPPLRARRDDVRLLFDHFLRRLSEQYKVEPCELTPAAMTALEGYEWPGNVRELKNIVERLAARFAGRVVSPSDLPPEIAHRPTPIAAAGAVGATQVPSRADLCYERMAEGHETFWSVVYEPFMSRDLTRDTVRAVVRRGLEHTRGSYRLLAQLFNLPATDYKRFLNFLQKYECHVPFQNFRLIPPRERREETAAHHAKAAV